MADDDNTSWAPQSPDLSELNAFVPEPPFSQLHQPPPPPQNPHIEQLHHPLPYGAQLYSQPSQAGYNKNGYPEATSQSAQMKSEDSFDDGDGDYHPNPSPAPTSRRVVEQRQELSRKNQS